MRLSGHLAAALCLFGNGEATAKPLQKLTLPAGNTLREQPLRVPVGRHAWFFKAFARCVPSCITAAADLYYRSLLIADLYYRSLLIADLYYRSLLIASR